MKASERDNLLIRLDERSRNTWHTVERLEKHQSEQNGFIQDTINRTTANTTWIKAFKWLIYIGVPAVVLLITHSYGLW